MKFGIWIWIRRVEVGFWMNAFFLSVLVRSFHFPFLLYSKFNFWSQSPPLSLTLTFEIRNFRSLDFGRTGESCELEFEKVHKSSTNCKYQTEYPAKPPSLQANLWQSPPKIQETVKIKKILVFLPFSVSMSQLSIIINFGLRPYPSCHHNNK